MSSENIIFTLEKIIWKRETLVLKIDFSTNGSWWRHVIRLEKTNLKLFPLSALGTIFHAFCQHSFTYNNNIVDCGLHVFAEGGQK